MLTNNPPPLPGLPSILGLTLSATDVRSQADFSVAFPNGNFATGDARFGSLTLAGTLIGRTLTFSGDAPANTVLGFSGQLGGFSLSDTRIAGGGAHLQRCRR